MKKFSQLFLGILLCSYMIAAEKVIAQTSYTPDSQELNGCKFDSDLWNAQRDAHGFGFKPMVGDLLKTHHLFGLSREKVKQLLGPPDLVVVGATFVYCLGPRRYDGFASLNLDIRFDDGAVNRYCIERIGWVGKPGTDKQKRLYSNCGKWIINPN
jgi:hypothetical protein